jgi:hypothetical protein
MLAGPPARRCAAANESIAAKMTRVTTFAPQGMARVSEMMRPARNSRSRGSFTVPVGSP